MKSSIKLIKNSVERLYVDWKKVKRDYQVLKTRYHHQDIQMYIKKKIKKYKQSMKDCWENIKRLNA
jgi:hypothetical protein